MQNNIRKEDLTLKLPELGGTVVILQRNAEDSEQTEARDFARTTFEAFLSHLTDEERGALDVLVVASDPRLGIRNIPQTELQTAIETGKEVLQSLKEVMQKNGLKDGQLINTTASAEGGVVEISEIKSARIINASMELGEFLEAKVKETGEDLWMVYETDKYANEREVARVESAAEVADRLEQFLTFVGGAANYHVANPNRRLLFWAVTHFDVAHSYLQRVVKDLNEVRELPLMEHLGGFILVIDKDGHAVVSVKDKTYQTHLDFSQVVTG